MNTKQFLDSIKAGETPSVNDHVVCFDEPLSPEYLVFQTGRVINIGTEGYYVEVDGDRPAQFWFTYAVKTV